MTVPDKGVQAEGIQTRKLKHIQVCLDCPVEYTTRTTGLEAVDWPYRALPELALSDVNLETTFLGRPLRAPILIGAMTGGAEFAGIINRNLALAAQAVGVGLMLGSQRVMLENPEARASFAVRRYAPDTLLIGNLGVAQFRKGYGQRQVRDAVELISADAIAFHTNPLQEAMQPGGDTDFRDLIPTLERIVPAVGVPVILKEVGHGLSGEVARAVRNVSFAALDVAGAGGTSWAKVESFARYGELRHADLCELGIPTAQALGECRQAVPDVPLVASGGIRTGLEIAKCLMLGARVVAIARPLLKPAIDGPEAVIEVLERLIGELRTALFVGGFGSVSSVAGFAADIAHDREPKSNER